MSACFGKRDPTRSYALYALERGLPPLWLGNRLQQLPIPRRLPRLRLSENVARDRAHESFQSPGPRLQAFARCFDWRILACLVILLFCASDSIATGSSTLHISNSIEKYGVERYDA